MNAASETEIDQKTTPRAAQIGNRLRSERLACAPLVAPARYVLLSLAEVVTGYSIKAMERKIERGDWTEGKVWRRAPDGHIVIDLQGYQRWV